MWDRVNIVILILEIYLLDFLNRSEGVGILSWDEFGHKDPENERIRTRQNSLKIWAHNFEK